MPAGSRLSRVNHWLSIKVCWQTEMVNCFCTGSLTEREFKVAKLIAALHAISASLHGIYSIMLTQMPPLEAVLLAVSSVAFVAVACCITLVLSSGFF
jgi:hypothetical protein